MLQNQEVCNVSFVSHNMVHVLCLNCISSLDEFSNMYSIVNILFILLRFTMKNEDGKKVRNHHLADINSDWSRLPGHYM